MAATGSIASTSAGGLRVDKAKTEAQLADWVHCVSAKTTQGQAKIRDLTNTLHTIDAKIQKVAEAEPAKAPAASTPTDTLGNEVDVWA